MAGSKSVIYIVGSLRNKKVPRLARRLRQLGYDVFDDWYAAGPEADDYWQAYEKSKKVTLRQALRSWAARHVFSFDKKHLTRSDIVILCMPCGKSGHLEFGWAIGQGAKGFVLFDKEPDRWDVMYVFATDVFMREADLVQRLQRMKQWRKRRSKSTDTSSKVMKSSTVRRAK